MTSTASSDQALPTASPAGSTPSGDGPVAQAAEIRPTERDLWGQVVIDAYGWLRDGTDPEVLAHLEAENAYTEAVLAPVRELRETLYEEIKGRIKETDLSLPVRKDGWAYYTRTVEGLAYPIHCRRPIDGASTNDADGTESADEDAVLAAIVAMAAEAEATGADGDPHPDEQVLLDENAEAGESEFFDVGPYAVSVDHRLLLWGWDRTGDERFTATVRDLASGTDGPDQLEDVSYSVVWALDNETVFYVKPDATNRPYQVWRHRLGTLQADDTCIFTEPDERYFVGVGIEKDDSYIQIGVSSKVTDEVWVIPADEPTAEPQLIAARRHGVEYSVAHHHDRFVILTNDGGAEDFKVVTAPEHDPSPENWTDLDTGLSGTDTGGPGSGPVTISDIDVSAEHLVLFERAGGQTRVRARRWRDGHTTEIEQLETPSTVWPGANPEFVSTHLRYGYSSMVSPPSVFSIDLESGERTLLKQQEVLGDFDADRYATDRLWAMGDDGVRVPISIVWRRDRPTGTSQPGPCLLYAYGAYEASMDPAFSAAHLSLLDRGFAFAIAHVRGGGEMGRRWYLDGKLEHKANTFSDVVACARHLIAEGWTAPEQLVLRGGSAGGLAVGAAMNLAPELFCAVVAQVPFVDIINTMIDTSLPLTVTEWEEWGNPAEDETAYRAMQSYCPYENVRPADYPSVLATGGLHDTRVGFWEPAKWAQVLRRETTSDAPVLLWIDLGAGHAGPSGRYDSWREEARILAYILWSVGLTT